MDPFYSNTTFPFFFMGVHETDFLYLPEQAEPGSEDFKGLGNGDVASPLLGNGLRASSIIELGDSKNDGEDHQTLVFGNYSAQQVAEWLNVLRKYNKEVPKKILDIFGHAPSKQVLSRYIEERLERHPEEEVSPKMREFIKEYLENEALAQRTRLEEILSSESNGDGGDGTD